MLASFFRSINLHVSWFASLLSSRFELEIPAYMVSLTMHAFFLVILALAGHHVNQVVHREFEGQVLDSGLSSSESTFQDLDQSAEPPTSIPAAGSFAPTFGSSITSMPSSTP